MDGVPRLQKERDPTRSRRAVRLRGSREPKAVTLSGLGRCFAVAAATAAAAACLLACITLGEYLLTRIGRPRKVQPDTKAVPSLLTKSTTICWLGLPSPHLSLPTVDLGRESLVSVSCCCAQFRDYLPSPRITTTNKVQTPHPGPPLRSHTSPLPTSSLLPPTNTTITITTTSTGRHYSLTRAPSLMPSLLVPPRSSPDAAQRHSARS